MLVEEHAQVAKRPRSSKIFLSISDMIQTVNKKVEENVTIKRWIKRFKRVQRQH
jgi:hypothetical protein